MDDADRRPVSLSRTPHPTGSAGHLLPQGEKGATRRAVLAAPLALAACDRFARAETPSSTDAPALKAIAPFPIGTCVRTDQINDSAWVALADRHVSQLTAEWQMKMEAVLAEGLDRPRFEAGDAIADFAAGHGMRLHGHALVWYAQGAEAFSGLHKAEFAAAYDAYIASVVGRYRGRAVSWDVVNEPLLDDGSALRDCLWAEQLGRDGYIVRAFEQAKAADPDAVLFLNDYNLENTPAKGATFLRLAERLLKAGAPLGGLGTQSHLDIEIPAGRIAAFIRDAASLGLPIHVSELDASLRSDRRIDLRTRDQRLSQQTARVAELADAFMALPDRQRFAFTVWGLRDTDSWLRRGYKDDGHDSPLPFDADGQPNPMLQALAGAFGAAS